MFDFNAWRKTELIWSTENMQMGNMQMGLDYLCWGGVHKTAECDFLCIFLWKTALQSVRGQGVSDSTYCSNALMSEHAKGYNLFCSTKWVSVELEQVVINL